LLDEIIDYQQYFNIAAENFTKNRRSLGIGITNLAALLAKNGLQYTDKEAPNLVDEWMERVQYYLLRASHNLAKEKGKCAYFDRTKYSKGILPIDTYKVKVDSVVTRKRSMDWEALRKDIVRDGLRNSTVTALMPCESSSIIQNSTNGIEPVRSLLTYKKSKSRTMPVLVPHFARWKNRYTLAYDMKDYVCIINIMAALQKYVDMSISGNLYYDYNHYEGGILPDQKVIGEMLYAYSMGIKSIYYTNTNDDAEDADTEKPLAAVVEAKDEGCESGACAI
jgi:ribonucleoside-diphosphate reductase alpha chain